MGLYDTIEHDGYSWQTKWYDSYTNFDGYIVCYCNYYKVGKLAPIGIPDGQYICISTPDSNYGKVIVSNGIIAGIIYD